MPVLSVHVVMWHILSHMGLTHCAIALGNAQFMQTFTMCTNLQKKTSYRVKYARSTLFRL